VAWLAWCDGQWGVFPRLAYEVFQEKQDTWKVSGSPGRGWDGLGRRLTGDALVCQITMKYFQNVVDTVRDLMSPTAQEKHYKDGGCMDGRNWRPRACLMGQHWRRHAEG
jgi:hypothetical protein